jgi:nitrite reductase/ring-hydroxylating ferredoxin subunit
MPKPSLMALVADMLGAPLDAPKRPSVDQARRSIRDNQVVAAADDSRGDVALYAVDGEVFTVADRCPHDGGLLSDGYISQGRLVCSRHGWEFDPRSGTCQGRKSRVCPLRLGRVQTKAQR